jgi:hypothetical protein
MAELRLTSLLKAENPSDENIVWQGENPADCTFSGTPNAATPGREGLLVL